jgi:uncharacterized membrane protein SpoIIM required for sporulation
LGIHSVFASVVRLARSCRRVFTGRIQLLIALNWLFFGSVLLSAFLAQLWPNLSDGSAEGFSPFSGNLLLLFLFIFTFNLIISAFLMLTLSGVLFFALPLVFLFVRGMIWGWLAFWAASETLLFALPTLCLEGEAYVLASAAGINIGLSWLKPGLTYKDEDLSRKEAFRRSWSECLHIYFLVSVLLLTASIAEVLTIYEFGTL